MKFFLTECAYLLLIINIFTNQVDSFEVSSLAVCCSLVNGTVTVPKPPEGCTAVALSTFRPDLLSALNLVKGDLPLMVIDDSSHLDQWPKIVESNTTEYVKTFNDIGVDVIAFDNLYDTFAIYKDEEFSVNIGNFIQNAKCDYPDMLFGIALTSEVDLSQSSVNVTYLNDYVDFFLLKPKEYRTCEYNDEQRKMPNVTTREDLSKEIEKLKASGMNTDKLIYSMQLKVYTLKRTMKVFNSDLETLTYYRLCTKKFSDDRKFCHDSIGAFFEKASLRISSNTLGIYVDGIENDDIDGSCQCGGEDGFPTRFKAVSIIAVASLNENATLTDVNCTSGEFPVIHRK